MYSSFYLPCHACAMRTVDLSCLFGQVDLGLMGLVPESHELTRPISVILVLIPKCHGLLADLHSASHSL